MFWSRAFENFFRLRNYEGKRAGLEVLGTALSVTYCICGDNIYSINSKLSCCSE